jgi:hypothetical protein
LVPVILGNVQMLSILVLGLLTKACLASDFWVSKWSETPGRWTRSEDFLSTY